MPPYHPQAAPLRGYGDIKIGSLVFSAKMTSLSNGSQAAQADDGLPDGMTWEEVEAAQRAAYGESDEECGDGGSGSDLWHTGYSRYR